MSMNIIKTDGMTDVGTVSTFPTTPHPDVSSKYVHIDTNRFIAAMQEEGFRVASILRSAKASAYAKHLVRFELEGAADLREDVRPQVVLINSHDRSKAASVGVGLIRFVCMNGMICGDGVTTDRVKHTGTLAEELIERARKLARNTAPLYSQIERWEAKELDRSQALGLATFAADLRFGDHERFTPEALLAPRRAEDEGSDLWNVFHRIQENAIKGGLHGRSARGRAVRSRPLLAVDADVRFNTQLWQAAAALAA